MSGKVRAPDHQPVGLAAARRLRSVTLVRKELHRKCPFFVQPTLPSGKFHRRNQRNREDARTLFSVQFAFMAFPAKLGEAVHLAHTLHR